MRCPLIKAALGISIMFIAPKANAAVFIFGVTLSGMNEVPQNLSPGTGGGRISVDDSSKTMRVEAIFGGLLGLTTAAHIHCCAPVNANAGVATTTPTFTGFPLGVTSGSMDETYDMTLSSSYRPQFLAASGGTTDMAFAQLLTAMRAGETYFNIHTSVSPSGEIRGQLLEVPEPTTWAMMLLGFGAIGAAMRVKNRQTVRVNFA